MKKYLFILFGLFSINTFSQKAEKSQLEFIENKNQWDSKIEFCANLRNGVLFLEKDGFTYTFFEEREHNHHLKNDSKIQKSVKAHSYKMNLIKCNINTKISASQPTTDYCNYFIGNDKLKWASNVKKYKLVQYSEIYENIDLKVYSNGFAPEYDFIIKPNGDYQKIVMNYDGVDNISIVNNKLIIKTSVNEVAELKPIAYKISKGEKSKIECNFKIDGNNVSFILPKNIDKNDTLIIDPVLEFSTYTGSIADNWSFTATYDKFGNVYTAGIVTNDYNYPTTTGAFQVNHAGGEGTFSWDISIMKLSPDGKTRLYSSYLGGNSSEIPQSIIVNENNELLIFGTTGSADFPISENAYDKTFNGGSQIGLDGNSVNYGNGSDIFISRISENGDKINASTFVGGSGNDGLNYKNYYNTNPETTMQGNDSLYYNYGDGSRGEIMVDANDNVYIGTSTFSADFPITLEAFQNKLSGKQEGLVFKIDSNLSSLMWSSYLGGSEDDAIYSLNINYLNEVYVTGGTVSINFPTTAGVYSPNFNGGTTDAFLTYISADGKTIKASTYFGSNEYDQSFNIKLDKIFNPYIIGQTKATGNTLIKNALYNVPNSGQFIAKFNPQLTNIEWSTVFGTGNGKPNISITAFSVDNCNSIKLAGWGRDWAYYTTGNWDNIEGTKGLPTTSDAYQKETDGQDFYIMSLSADASKLEYATFLGELHSDYNQGGIDHVDGGTSRFDINGNLYQAACASCGGNNNFPTTDGVVGSENLSMNCNNAVFKLSFACNISSISDGIANEYISIFPNPTNDVLFIKNANSEFSKIEIFDIKGSLILTKKLISNEQKINVNSLQKGIYFIYLMNETGEVKTVKMVK